MGEMQINQDERRETVKSTVQIGGIRTRENREMIMKSEEVQF